MRPRNYVAKHMRRTTRAAPHKDRRKAERRGERKHKRPADE